MKENNFTEEQLNAIKASENKIAVQAAAGSGKTLVLTERVKYLLDKGINPKKMVVITFTNSAAEEMRDRIGIKGKDCFIGTVHAYCNYLLTSRGYDTRKYLDKEQFDELFKLINEHTDCIQEVEHLLLDEAQDSTTIQFEFMLDMINPKNFFIVFDHRQSIYGFSDADPEYVYKLSRRSGVKLYELNNNYRNAPQVLSYAKDFLEPLGYKYYDNSIAKSKEYGQIYRISYSADKIGKFILDSEDEFSDWFVLARTNALVEEIQSVFASMGIPCETFKKAELSNSDLKKKMENNTVKVLTIHTSKGLEAKNVVVVGAQYYNDEERRINYVAATRAKELLVWCTTPKRTKRKYDVESWD